MDHIQYAITHGIVLGLITAIVINRISKWLHNVDSIYPLNITASKSDYYRWRYRNFLISFLHASISGIGSMSCLFLDRPVLLDSINTYSEFAYYLAAFSFGYFIYDTVEMIGHTEYKGTQELIFHHVLIMICFANTLITSINIGYTMIALSIEVSNIFLHFRQLMLLGNCSKSSALYRINSIVNIAFFFMVRGSGLLLIWYKLVTNFFNHSLVTLAIGIPSVVGISFTSVVLLRRILNADFFSGDASGASSSQNPTKTTNKNKMLAAGAASSSLYDNDENDYRSELKIPEYETNHRNNGFTTTNGSALTNGHCNNNNNNNNNHHNGNYDYNYHNNHKEKCN